LAKYGYNELKVAAIENRRIGGYKGKNVFSCSQWRYENRKDQDNFYVLYDDGNKLVHKGIIYGTISDGGLVDEWECQRTWVSPQSQVEVKFEPVSPAKYKAKAAREETRSVPASDYSAFVNGGEGIVNSENFFANLDREINELLATPFEAGDMPWVKNEV
jgi:hypothetical protein